jgi:hypothetical protein
MRRKLEVFTAPQKAILRRQTKEGGALGDRQLADAFRSELQKLDVWMWGRDNFALLHVNYDDDVLYDSEHAVTGSSNTSVISLIQRHDAINRKLASPSPKGVTSLSHG